MSKDIKKALKAGYDTATPEHTGEEIENVEANKPTMDSNKVESKDINDLDAAVKEIIEEAEEKVEAKEEETKEEEKVEAKEEETKEEQIDTSEKTNGGKVTEIKFDDSLFKPYTLGSTLKKEPHGNVMQNVKKPAMDYDKVYKDTIRNQKLTKDDFEKE